MDRDGSMSLRTMNFHGKWKNNVRSVIYTSKHWIKKNIQIGQLWNLTNFWPFWGQVEVKSKNEWQCYILLVIPVILVCHKTWFENLSLWPTFWHLPIFDLEGQTEIKRTYLWLCLDSLFAYQISKQLVHWFLRYVLIMCFQHLVT